jgi:hypothetical protein
MLDLEATGLTHRGRPQEGRAVELASKLAARPVLRCFRSVPVRVTPLGIAHDAEVLADGGAAGEDGDVLQHGLAAIAEAGGLHGRDFQSTAQLVDHERGERFALDVLGDDEKRLAGLHHRFKKRQQLVERRELLSR